VSGRYLARCFISLKPTVNDPAGITIRGALTSLGFATESVRSGKYFQVVVQAASSDDAREQAERMCARLLANPVIETYSVEVEPAGG
jgi:phosphoribosylformylglycinamidine synthase